MALERKGKDYKKENIEVWHAMEELYKSGRIRAIGVSNFDVEYLQVLMDNCSVKPMVNQIRFFIGTRKKKLPSSASKTAFWLRHTHL